jgi:hypothetical protein
MLLWTHSKIARTSSSDRRRMVAMFSWIARIVISGDHEVLTATCLKGMDNSDEMWPTGSFSMCIICVTFSGRFSV